MIELGAMTFDRRARRMKDEGQDVVLTLRELALLNLLLTHESEVLSKTRLFEGLFSFAAD
ncbi:hypothetical protein [Qingshengfaniella alkalisoli]|uniref:OmpR/PhoB-type domain-containing protein n=1 Tax=Qingshengfaniella alkalisoli TaxID=2599296 RepID=A0A5B8J3Q4_9RHOB|nr:hypothetical protein [Qingshengfaniella alkalisoli]QDY71338.1 hypothetical protein FPZ52_16685 [Qingshengfaniella alkalisoli]